MIERQSASPALRWFSRRLAHAQRYYLREFTCDILCRADCGTLRLQASAPNALDGHIKKKEPSYRQTARVMKRETLRTTSAHELLASAIAEDHEYCSRTDERR